MTAQTQGCNNRLPLILYSGNEVLVHVVASGEWAEIEGLFTFGSFLSNTVGLACTLCLQS